MVLQDKIKNFISHNWQILSLVLLLVVSFVFFTFLQAVPAFADPDSFYHVKATQLIIDEGIVKEFPWLQFTVLRDNYIDQHFLYHLFLVPFVVIMDPLQGAKLANVILTTLLILIFYWFLKSNKIRLAGAYTTILLLTMPFIFRINLVKAPAFALIILLLGLYCILKHKSIALFLISFFYVWAYGGFILLLVFSGLYAFISLLHNWLKAKVQTKFWTVFGHSQEVKLFFISLAGTVAGVVVNPYFPQNIGFYWQQLVKIGIVNYQNVISVGNEWYPYKFIDLTANTAFISILLVAVLYLMVVNFKKPTRQIITTFIIYIFFFVFTLKSRRYVEYYAPFALIFVAFALNQYLKDINWFKIKNNFVSFCLKHKIIAVVLIVYFLTTLPTVIIKDVRSTYGNFTGGIALNRFEQASIWLKGNSQPGEIVFHSSWDEFPILFYFNSNNYYIAGLDPTFSYEFDRVLYRKMVDITIGEQKNGIYDDLKNNFNASYVFVEKNHHAMESNIRAEPRFEEVYQDDEAIIFKVL